LLTPRLLVWDRMSGFDPAGEFCPGVDELALGFGWDCETEMDGHRNGGGGEIIPFCKQLSAMIYGVVNESMRMYDPM
jgi:hypothetical protein